MKNLSLMAKLSLGFAALWAVLALVNLALGESTFAAMLFAVLNLCAHLVIRSIDSVRESAKGD